MVVGKMLWSRLELSNTHKTCRSNKIKATRKWVVSLLFLTKRLYTKNVALVITRLFCIQSQYINYKVQHSIGTVCPTVFVRDV